LETESIIDNDFAEFDEEEDEHYIKKSKKEALKKKGINPKSGKKKEEK